MRRINQFIVLFFIFIAVGCGGGNGDNQDTSIPEPVDNPVVDVVDNGEVLEQYELLFMGNSHSAANSLPDIVTRLIEVGLPGSTARAELAPGSKFLDERLADGHTHNALLSHQWTHVVLQAQKYSSSGAYFYSTYAAEEWIRRVKAQNAAPILFPEWRRRGNNEEGLRIHELHLSIAVQEPACVAPVGLAWEESILRYPNLDLHAPDGNHSNLTGALLTAYVFYQVITKQSVLELPYIPEISVSQSVQQQLREVAAFAVGSHLYCP